MRGDFGRGDEGDFVIAKIVVLEPVDVGVHLESTF